MANILSWTLLMGIVLLVSSPMASCSLKDALSKWTEKLASANLYTRDEYVLNDNMAELFCAQNKTSGSGYMYYYTTTVSSTISNLISAMSESQGQSSHNAIDCNITVIAPDQLGSHYLLTFVDDNVNVEEHANCSAGTKLTIYDGEGTNSVVLKDFCGHNTVNSTNRYMETPSNTFTIRVERAANVTYPSTGFRLLYTAFDRSVDGNCTGQNISFLCDTDRCISNKYQCDAAANCIDGSDESTEKAGCNWSSDVLAYLLGLGFLHFMIIIASIGLVILIISIIGIVCCCVKCKCCKKCCPCCRNKSSKIKRINVK